MNTPIGLAKWTTKSLGTSRKLLRRLILSLTLLGFVNLLLPDAVLALTLMERWDALIVEGQTRQAKHDFLGAIRDYGLAAHLCEIEPLPAKCLPIALCRLAMAEILSNQIDAAEDHFNKVITVIKAQKVAHTLHQDVFNWLVDLAEKYQSHEFPKTRETCLKHACQLKALAFGSTHKETVSCLQLLVNYYLEQGQVGKAVSIITTVVAAQEKTVGKNPNTLGLMLNQLAIDCKTKHKYDQAKQLELHVIDLARLNSSILKCGLPAFYSFLGMNSLCQGKSTESKQYFAHSIKECRTIKTEQEKLFARPFIELLVESTKADLNKEHGRIAELELLRLLEIERKISTDQRWQYSACSLMAETLRGQNDDKHMGAYYLNRAIVIARLPNSYVEKDLPDLYMRLAMRQGSLEKASAAYATALSLEKDKVGFHTTLVLYWWGVAYGDRHQYSIAIEKWNMALANARAIASDKRGTLVADTLSQIAMAERRLDKAPLATSLDEQSAAEIQLQKKLKSKLGPDIFHRL